MKGRYLFDWFAFSVRIDEAYIEKFSKDEEENANNYLRIYNSFNLSLICGVLGMDEGCFELDTFVRSPRYLSSLSCNGITLHIPHPGTEISQGFFVVMTGEGCRFYESRFSSSHDEIWKALFNRVRQLPDFGFAVNIPRLDVAVDDFSGILNLGLMWECVLKREFCSRFHKKPIRKGGVSVQYTETAHLIETGDCEASCPTIYFGSRKSRSFCRFYDKLSEQKEKHKDHLEELEKLSSISSWVRMEFEFKNENAIVMVNAFCDEQDFSFFYSEYVNGMLRFVDRDDVNISRCSVKSWWREFTGALGRLSLSIGEYKPRTRKDHMKYVYKMLTASIFTAMVIDGVKEFVDKILEMPLESMKRKHRELCGGFEDGIPSFCSRDVWEVLNSSRARRSVLT